LDKLFNTQCYAWHIIGGAKCPKDKVAWNKTNAKSHAINANQRLETALPSA